MRTLLYLLWSVVLVLSWGCAHKRSSENQKLVSLQMIDRHGFNETISAPDRVSLYEETDFLSSQSYSKVVRVFSRTKSSPSRSIITSYHDNGLVHQYLEIENGRAHGLYKQWYPSGALHLQATVLEGIGDVSESAMASWVFDKESIVYNESGSMIAKIAYQKGELTGDSTYFHLNGQIRKISPFLKNEIHGKEQYFDQNGELVGTFHYENGLKDGKSEYLGDEASPKFLEDYKKGKLLNAKYFDKEGHLVSAVQNGNGLQTCYEKGVLSNQYEIREGKRQGKIYCYDSTGKLEREYIVFNDEKHGEEWIYDTTSSDKKRPKMCLSWYKGKIQGRVKTWYTNGQLESEKEMHDNKKNGLLTAWYLDGTVMMIEEYENDCLVKGTYMKKGEKSPTSTIARGQGIATIYDANGYFLRRVEYAKGVPVEL